MNMSIRANAVGKDVSEVDRAYLAGFLDADGAIMATIERHAEKKYRFRTRITVKVTQSSPAVLCRFKDQFGVGLIRCNRTTYDWQVRDQQDAAGILRSVLPFLQVKKPQAVMALEIITNPVDTLDSLIANARKADALSRFNV